MTEILLVRHGETDWNRERRLQGHSDRPLSEEGRAQATALARTLAGERLDAVYASDLSRARDTALAVAELHGLEVTVLPELRERSFGTWEGLTDAEIRERFPDHAGPWGDGETHAELEERLLRALRRIADRHPRGRVLVVSHGGAIRRLLLHCSPDVEPAPIVNCHVARLAFEHGSLRQLG